MERPRNKKTKEGGGEKEGMEMEKKRQTEKRGINAPKVTLTSGNIHLEVIPYHSVY